MEQKRRGKNRNDHYRGAADSFEDEDYSIMDQSNSMIQGSIHDNRTTK